MIDINAPIYPMVNQLFEEDCLECMKRIPNESIDMILCDLPYGMTQNKWDSYIHCLIIQCLRMQSMRRIYQVRLLF